MIYCGSSTPHRAKLDRVLDFVDTLWKRSAMNAGSCGVSPVRINNYLRSAVPVPRDSVRVLPPVPSVDRD